MVAVAIVAVLASIGLPLAELAHRRVREEELRQALREIRSALDAYKKASDQGRISHPADASGYPPSLDVLVNGVPDVTSAKGGKLVFLRRVPQDPFASDEMSDSVENWALRSYDSPADRPMPGKDVFDVRSKSLELGLNGVPYRSW